MRSLLFTPALRPDRAAKAWGYGPDSVILDLEDAVAAERKAEARDLANGLISQENKPWTVRINDLGTRWWQDDLAAILHPHLAYVMLPKTGGAEDVRRLDDILSTHEAATGRADPIGLLPIIETVEGLANAADIARASPRVVALTFGEGDFSLDLGIDWDPFGPTLTAAKIDLVFASRLAGIAPPHAGAYPRLHDPEGLERSCRLGKQLGFGAKHCIHPEQLETVRRIFAPSAEAVRRAQDIVEKFEQALGEGAAAITVGTEFVDYPVYHRALQTLEEAKIR
jgi:citrate lyase subunit beta/citryl-CoA lyase